jgi:multisubunit Na+/H+ antiporter MnhG subunit
MNGENRDRPPVNYVINSTVVTVLAKIGCLTFIIGATAIFGGIWLDAQLGTRPWLTLAFFILSVPVVTYVIIKVTTSSTKHLADPSTKPKKQNRNKEETNRE